MEDLEDSSIEVFAITHWFVTACNSMDADLRIVREFFLLPVTLICVADNYSMVVDGDCR